MPDGSKWYTKGRSSVRYRVAHLAPWCIDSFTGASSTLQPALPGNEKFCRHCMVCNQGISDELLSWQTHIPYRGSPWNRGRLGSDDGQQEAQLMAEMQHCQVSCRPGWRQYLHCIEHNAATQVSALELLLVMRAHCIETRAGGLEYSDLKRAANIDRPSFSGCMAKPKPPKLPLCPHSSAWFWRTGRSWRVRRRRRVRCDVSVGSCATTSHESCVQYRLMRAPCLRTQSCYGHLPAARA